MAVNDLLGEGHRPNCKFQLRHKDLFFNPLFLEKYGIEYQVVVTEPGDLLFLDSNVYHFGGCLSDPCINMAANIAGDAWVKTAYEEIIKNHPNPSKDQYFEIENCNCSQTCRNLLKFKISKEFLNKLKK